MNDDNDDGDDENGDDDDNKDDNDGDGYNVAQVLKVNLSAFI